MARGLRDHNLDELTGYELIDLLDELNPRWVPQPDIHSKDYIMFESGKRDLIETLLSIKEREINERRNSKVEI
jgi:hypothetical protein